MSVHACSKHLLDDWLERMFHSCQHRQPQAPVSSSDNPESHPLLMSHLVRRRVVDLTAITLVCDIAGDCSACICFLLSVCRWVTVTLYSGTGQCTSPHSTA